MENKVKLNEPMRGERVENLMLMSVLGQEPFRAQALQELQRRRLIPNPDQFVDAFMTNLGVAC